MPRVRVIADDGWVALDERVGPEDFDGEVFRRHLAERLAWAVGDAEEHAEARACEREAERSRVLALAA
ncbi:MAG: hypothetical protein HZB46_00500 [Solirubrobacterales bacterium]|nr:hypothetical protein [Solirubrobacterales bacterium]